MTTYPNESYQIHNYSFAAVKAFIQEVQKYPIIYKEHSRFSDSSWSEIVRNLLESDRDYILTSSQKIYWKRLYRGLWMWMRHILIMNMVNRYLGQAEMSQNPKYVWLEYLKFLEPYIQLRANSFYYDTDLDPFINFQVLSSVETIHMPYHKYMVYWRHNEETLIAETFFISMCVSTIDYYSLSEHLKLEFELYLPKLNDIGDVAKDEIPVEEVKALSQEVSTALDDSIPEEVNSIIDEQLKSSVEENADYEKVLSRYITNLEQFDV